MTVERQTMEVDIACVGFGPAMGGFLTTLSRALVDENGMPLLESGVMPGMPLQVLCYERADDISFGVSGVVTRARSIRSSFPELDPAAIPMATPVSDEKVLYLLDPLKASRRSFGIKAVDALLGPFSGSNHAFELPYIPLPAQTRRLGFKGLTEQLGFPLAHEPVVDVDAGEPVSDSPVNERRGDGQIYPARKAADDQSFGASRASMSVNPGTNLLGAIGEFDEVGRGPGWPGASD